MCSGDGNVRHACMCMGVSQFFRALGHGQADGPNHLTPAVHTCAGNENLLGGSVGGIIR